MIKTCGSFLLCLHLVTAAGNIYWKDPPFTLSPEAISANVTLSKEKVSIPESFQASTPLLLLNYNDSLISGAEISEICQFLSEKYSNTTLYYTENLDFDTVSNKKLQITRITSHKFL